MTGASSVTTQDSLFALDGTSVGGTLQVLDARQLALAVTANRTLALFKNSLRDKLSTRGADSAESVGGSLVTVASVLTCPAKIGHDAWWCCRCMVSDSTSCNIRPPSSSERAVAGGRRGCCCCSVLLARSPETTRDGASSDGSCCCCHCGRILSACIFGGDADDALRSKQWQQQRRFGSRNSSYS